MYILVKNLNGRLIFIMDNEVDFEVLLNELKVFWCNLSLKRRIITQRPFLI